VVWGRRRRDYQGLVDFTGSVCHKRARGADQSRNMLARAGSLGAGGCVWIEEGALVIRGCLGGDQVLDRFIGAQADFIEYCRIGVRISCIRLSTSRFVVRRGNDKVRRGRAAGGTASGSG
jgi:hypothetical protein